MKCDVCGRELELNDSAVQIDGMYYCLKCFMERQEEKDEVSD